MRSAVGMVHSASCWRYFSFMGLGMWGRILEVGMGVRQHFGGQWVSVSRALLVELARVRQLGEEMYLMRR